MTISQLSAQQKQPEQSKQPQAIANPNLEKLEGRLDEITSIMGKLQNQIVELVNSKAIDNNQNSQMGGEQHPEKQHKKRSKVNGTRIFRFLIQI